MDAASTAVHKKPIFAQNTGVCMEESPGIGLHLGSGRHNWAGWFNVDLAETADIRCDIRKLEIDDNYADVAVSIHVLEHFYQWEAKPLLEEWKRVLKPGGRLILELPCLDKVLFYITNCINNKIEISPTFSLFVFWGDPKYKNEFMVHKWGYTMKMLEDLLLECGFSNIEFEEPRYHFKDRDMRITAIKG